MSIMNKGKYSGDNWAIITPVDLSVKREKHGYDVLETHIIECADCGKKLIQIIKVKEDDTKKKIIKATCPCGGDSFIREVTGQTYIHPADGVSISDMPTDIIDGIMHINVKVI